jgi:hypothetical protein
MRNIWKTIEHLLHGETPTRNGLMLIYGTGIVVGIMVGFVAWQTRNLHWLAWLFLVEMALDIGGGVVANLTRSTSAYYATRPRWVSVVFLLVHFVHPLVIVLALASDGSTPALAWGIFVYGYALFAGNVVLALRAYAEVRVVAISLLALGISAQILLITSNVLLLALGTLYLIKLIYAFALDHDRASTASHKLQPQNNFING